DRLVVRRHDDARQEQHDDSEDRLLDSPGKRDRESERRNERKGGEHRPSRREPEGGSFQPAPREDEDASPNVPQRSSYAVRQQEDPAGRDDPGAKCDQRSDEPRGSHPERTPTIPPFAPHDESADRATRDHEMQHFHGGQAGTNEAQEEQHEDPRTERLEDENAGGPSELPVVRGPVLLSVHEEHDRGGDVVHPDGLHEEAEPAPQTRDEQPATAVGIQVTEERLGSERREEEIVPGREASEVVRHAPGNAQQDHEPAMAGGTNRADVGWEDTENARRDETRAPFTGRRAGACRWHRRRPRSRLSVRWRRSRQRAWWRRSRGTPWRR